ncbi:hypothetical protein [Curtobacterium sp. MCPF17_052]|uniref:hypothetical protein n=1 Tax=Curtobacterium sp. MCPF17_052 TaxID=2175655 RepID=UPI0024DF6E44|nr:hypothetical protein [Curtobacterium sp. MCPF17_052]WIB12131.1 hypothetical protein DEJ36_15380 [Curtobacterium sp. MCPF17_052]
MPVWAWVQFPTFHVRVKAFARSWTRDAVLVEWAQFGQQADAWIWRSAVKHRTLRAVDPRTGHAPTSGSRSDPPTGEIAFPGVRMTHCVDFMRAGEDRS